MVKNIWSFIFLLNFAPALMGQEGDTVLAKMIETMDKEPSSRAIASRGLPLLLYNTISSQSKY